MSGQIDVGWSVPPIGLAEVDAGKIRIIARGADGPALAEQTTRVNIVNADCCADHPDVVDPVPARLRRQPRMGLQRSASADQWYAEGINIDPALGQRVRDTVLPEAGDAAGRMIGLEATLKQAIELKRLPASTTLAQMQAVIEIPQAPVIPTRCCCSRL